MSDPPSAELRADHTPSAIRARLDDGGRPDYLRDVVFGAMDGAVSTFAIVTGAIGAGLGSGTIVVIGIAKVLADALSMAGANYLATRTDEDRRTRLRAEEEAQLDAFPEGEREEVRQIFARKGFAGADLDRAVEVITSDRERWLDTMLREEHDLPLGDRSARRAAIATFLAFVAVGALPLLPFVAALAFDGIVIAFVASVFLTAAAFVLIGAAKGLIIGHPWRLSAFETLLVGSAASGVAFAVGLALRGIADAT